MVAVAATSVLSPRLGPYRVVRELGRGGMGVVCEAEHERLGRRVAIKRLLPHLQDDPASVQRFAREGRAACKVRHPSVVEIHEIFDHGGVPHLVMELLEGEHLGAKLARGGPLPLPVLVELLVPIIAGVATAHAAGVVHRDLKPSNIMLTRSLDGRALPKVLDFGTSKLSELQTEEALTATGAMLGTLQYMSPEQLAQPKTAGPAADQYSLGAILFECATGERPYSGDGCYALMQAIMTAPLARPSDRRPGLPPEFDQLIARAMARRPGRRFACVADLGLSLLRFGTDELRAAYQSELQALSEAVRERDGDEGARPRATPPEWPDPAGPELPTTWPDFADTVRTARSASTRSPGRALHAVRGFGLSLLLVLSGGLAAQALLERWSVGAVPAGVDQVSLPAVTIAAPAAAGPLSDRSERALQTSLDPASGAPALTATVPVASPAAVGAVSASRASEPAAVAGEASRLPTPGRVESGRAVHARRRASPATGSGRADTRALPDIELGDNGAPILD